MGWERESLKTSSTTVYAFHLGWLARKPVSPHKLKCVFLPPGSPFQLAGFLQERKTKWLVNYRNISPLCSHSERSGLVWPYLTSDPETKALSKLVTERVRLPLSAPTSLFAGASLGSR